MEGYMLGGENIPETRFKGNLAKAAGVEILEEFIWEFRKRFITEEDAERIKKLGFNCVRIPFNHKVIDPRGMELLKQAVAWFTKRKIYVILDMHAVPGCQNKDWHADSCGEMLFYSQKENQDRYVDLWKELSKVFKNEEYVAAYDIMNEPVTQDLETLKEAYRAVIKIVRDQDDQHIIFLEGNMWAQEVEFLADIVNENRNNNVALSVHFYEPVEFVFNQDSSLKYPGVVKGKSWSKDSIHQKLSSYAKYDVPIYVGEWGVASDAADRGAYDWVKDTLKVMDDLKYHWTYWTYKSVKGMQFPDGLYQCSAPENILAGMDKIAAQLTSDKKKFYQHLDTKKFNLNEKVKQIIS